MKAERQAVHVDVVRRVESGHVLVLESWDLRELVGELANARAEGWSLVSVASLELAMGRGPCYTAAHVRGVPGSPIGMEMAGGVGNE